MYDLNDMACFAQVVKHQGFAAASRATGIPKSRLSRRVSQLEARLGVTLLQRSTRQIHVTELGQAYYEQCLAMLEQADAADALVQRAVAEPCGLIRLSCPPELLCFAVGDLLSGFMARYPAVRVQLESTGRRVDMLNDGIDLAIRVRFPPFADSDLHVRQLAFSPQHLVAAPSLLTTKPRTPDDLDNLPSLDWKQADGRHSWKLIDADGVSSAVHHQPVLVTDDLNMLLNAACKGVGVVQLPWLVAGRAIKAGQLVPLLPDWQLATGAVQAVFPSRRGLLPAVRALIDYLAAHFAELDYQTGDETPA